ncbi:UPF0161 protein At3g09310 [Carica papaya]|uniref:UPF0161 protein At3g09310 n=1 Tax=Carica papaya TaxID=3649 RepID=UPI000B8CDC97|nr:UPF0161 protein At3g09310 [Carica papaya]
MAMVASPNCRMLPFSVVQRQKPNFSSLQFPRKAQIQGSTARYWCVRFATAEDQNSPQPQDEEGDSLGVKAALSLLQFYKREISPLMPKSCRYIPTCSEYSMEAYKKYGVVKGTVLTAWRLCRCNPLGGSGFDPPRWYDETRPTEE